MRLTRLLTALLFVSTSPLLGQGVPPTGTGAPRSEGRGLSIATDTYGTASLTWLTLSAWDFHPLASTDTYAWTNVVTGNPIQIGIYNTNGVLSRMAAPLHLPEGALVSSFEFQACDTNATYTEDFYFEQVPKTGTSYSESLLTRSSAGAGCSLFAATFPITIDNANNSYFLMAAFQTSGTSLVLQSVRVGYRLQVSPPPGTATFGDVPTTHLFFQYVEALAAAGITSGCGGGNFCPDAAVTRGQMAVFLAKALGLHWAP